MFCASKRHKSWPSGLVHIVEGLQYACGVFQTTLERERKKETPSGAQNGNTNTGSSGSQNLVSTDGIDPIDEREIYSDGSDEDMMGGVYIGYAAEMTGDIPVDSEEYLSDDSTDSEFCYNYRNKSHRHPHAQGHNMWRRHIG